MVILHDLELPKIEKNLDLLFCFIKLKVIKNLMKFDKLINRIQCLLRCVCTPVLLHAVIWYNCPVSQRKYFKINDCYMYTIIKTYDSSWVAPKLTFEWHRSCTSVLAHLVAPSFWYLRILSDQWLLFYLSSLFPNCRLVLCLWSYH